MSEKKVHDYPGTEIDVQWDSRLCIHIAECGKSAGELFVGGRDPWCIPDKCSKADVERQFRHPRRERPHCMAGSASCFVPLRRLGE
jgi:uncharacterized Fe-S cluster protein YjdI